MNGSRPASGTRPAQLPAGRIAARVSALFGGEVPAAVADGYHMHWAAGAPALVFACKRCRQWVWLSATRAVSPRARAELERHAKSHGDAQ